MSDRVFWNNVFNHSRELVIQLETLPPTADSRKLAVELQTNWNFLVIDNKAPNATRLHQDRFDRYHNRILNQINRHLAQLALVK